MTTAPRLLAALSGGALGLVAAIGPGTARAQPPGLELIKGGGTPAAINGLPSSQRLSCPLLVKPSDAELQPLSIHPSQVAAKNQLGCLSASDAIYAADGCPSKLCGPGKGVIPLPPGSGRPAPPQLPQP